MGAYKYQYILFAFFSRLTQIFDFASSIAAYIRCAFSNKFYARSSSKRILKIGYHLVKSQPKQKWHVFTARGVELSLKYCPR